MIQRGEEMCFSLEPCEAFRIVAEAIRDDLDGDIAPELRVARPVDFTLSPAPIEAMTSYDPNRRADRSGALASTCKSPAGLSSERLTESVTSG
jgi:hypothetical protein